MSTNSSQPSSLEALQPQPSQSKRAAEAKTAFLASLESTGSAINTELQSRAKNIHANSTALSKQEKDLQKETKSLAKQNDAMQKFVDKSKMQLSAYDDLGKIEEGLDDDLADLEAMLDMIEGGHESDGGPPSHTPR